MQPTDLHISSAIALSLAVLAAADPGSVLQARGGNDGTHHRLGLTARSASTGSTPRLLPRVPPAEAMHPLQPLPSLHLDDLPVPHASNLSPFDRTPKVKSTGREHMFKLDRSDSASSFSRSAKSKSAEESTPPSPRTKKQLELKRWVRLHPARLFR